MSQLSPRATKDPSIVFRVPAKRTQRLNRHRSLEANLHVPGDSRKLLSLSEIRRPCWDSLTPVTGSGGKGIPRADHTHEKCSGTFSVICTPFSFSGRGSADHVQSSRPELSACVPGSERLHGDRRDRFLRLVFLGCSSDRLSPRPPPTPPHPGGRDRKPAPGSRTKPA